jgi:hypothetical protein
VFINKDDGSTHTVSLDWSHAGSLFQARVTKIVFSS